MRKPLSKKNKTLIGIITPITALLLAFIILCIVTASLYSSAFLGRMLVHTDSSVSDYKIFQERVISKSEQPYSYQTNINPTLDDLTVAYSNKQKTLSKFIKSTKTTSFIIVRNDEIVYEKYANGYDKNSINTSFSMAKSVVSLLIGKAIENGYIAVNDPIEKYISEFSGKEIGKTTIEDLLLMRSNIVYDENKYTWFSDDTLTYWYDNLRELALSHTELTNKYGGKFHYNNYHPLLLGIILERSTGVTVSQFFEREIWQKMGAEHDASWSLDSKKHGFEKMESGINFRAVDFIKLGSLVIHNGYWNDAQIIDKDWLALSTVSELPINNDEYDGSFLSSKNIGYKYMWYYTPSDKYGCDIIAWGKSDQILYISPANDTVVLRTGKTDGGVSDWVKTLQNIISQI